VQWEEINIALGQVCLMVCAFYAQIPLPMKYIISPLGQFSKISAIQSTNSKNQKELKYELYLPSNEKNFNEGIANLVEDISELCNYLINKLKEYKITVFPPFQ
jgi:Apg6 BARA domain